MVKIRNEYDGSFAARSSEIERICELLEDKVGTVEISTGCFDDVQREFSSFKELDSYENSLAREILDLSIQAHSRTETNSEISIGRASVHFDRCGHIHITVEGEELHGVNLKDRLRYITEGTRAWYGGITRVLQSDVWRPGAFLMWGATIAYLYTVLTSGIPPSPDTLPLASFYLVPLGVLVGVVICIAPPLVVVHGLNWLQRTLFPKTYFALGQGEERYKVKDRLRWWSLAILGALILTSTFFVVERLT